MAVAPRVRKRSQRGRVNAPMVAAGIATVVCLILYAGHGRPWTVPGIDRLERNSVDARFEMRGGRKPVDDRIVIVAIDDETKRRYPEMTQTRRGWAELVSSIASFKPKVIALDLFFSSPEVFLPPEVEAEVRGAHADMVQELGETPAQVRAREALSDVIEVLRGDELLTTAIAEAGNVYLGLNFRLVETKADIPEVPPAERPGTGMARYGESAAARGDNQPPLAYSVRATMPEIGKGAVGAGALNASVDGDGVSRRVPMAIQHGDRHYMPLGLSVALAELGRPHDSSYIAGRDSVSAGGMTLPLGVRGSALINFLGPGRTFTHVSAADVIDAAKAGVALPLEGKLVFVGYTFGETDTFATPYDQLFPGVEMHATLTHNILHGELLRPAGRGVTFGAIAILGAVLAALQLRRMRRRPWVPAAGAAVLLIGWGVIGYLWFARGGVIVELTAPFAAGAVIAIAAGVTALATEGREKARLRQAFSQYVSSTLVERILASPELTHLGGERRELTVMFSDIRGFSGLAEALEPEALASFLNEYLTPMSEIVLDSSGTLDKYIGDAVMAIWGAPVDLPDHPERACRAALAMLERLAPMNAAWKAAGLPEIQIGIGLNTGPMAVGNMGSEARFDYTVLGDAVNTAARLEGLTKEYEVDVLVGDATAKAAAAAFVFRELDWVRVKGRGGSAAVHELLGPISGAKLGEADRADWAEGLAAYRARDFDRAVEKWGDLAIRHPDDGAARVMRARAEALRADPPPADWDGVYEQRSK